MVENHLTSTVWQMLMGRTEGPLTLRLILQPVMASLFALRAALRDVRGGRPPYLWKIFTNPGRRYELLREGWKHIRMVFLVALLLDSVYQVIVFRWIYPVQAVIVAIVLAMVPYALVRGPVNRLARRLGARPSAPKKP